MISFAFKIPIKPVSRSYSLFLTKCKDAGRGPGFIQCDCGQHFGAWFRTPGDEYGMFKQLVDDAINAEMGKQGVFAPLTGPVELSVVITVQRPMNHYIGADRARPVKENCLLIRPTGSPSAIGVLDALQYFFLGRVYNDRRQISRPFADKLYDEEDAINIRVGHYDGAKTDPRNKQLELF